MGEPKGKSSDSLLRHPSSKIVSCKNGQLSFKRDVLSQVIDKSQRALHYEVDFPVSLISIVGTPSNERSVLFQSLINYYDNNSDRDGGGTSGGNHGDGNNAFTFPDANDDLSESGIYLLHKPFHFDLKIKDQILVWILYLYQGSNGTDEENQLLERFLLLASSRIAEVILPDEEIRILWQWQELSEKMKNISKSFLYVLPSDHVDCPEGACLFTNIKARKILIAKMDKSCAHNGNAIQIENVPDINVIEMKGLNTIGNGISHSIINCIRDMPRASRFYKKQNKCGKSVRLSTFQQLMEECEHVINSNFSEMPGTSTGPISSNQGQAREFPSSSNMLSVCFGSGGGGHDDDSNDQSNPRQLEQPITNSLALTSQPNRTEGASYANQNPQSHQGYNEGPAPSPDNGVTTHQESGPRTERVDSPVFDKPKETPKDHTAGSVPDREIQLARELIPEMTSFYNDEMKRFLAESLYAQDVLTSIHIKLADEITSQFSNTFNLNDDHREIIIQELKSSLDKYLPRHLQRNSENWKMKQAKISKSIQKMMSLYMERIENVLLQNPQGLDDQKLLEERNKIIEDIKQMLGVEIHEKVREEEPLQGHLASLLTEIEEYWECVQERNNANFERARQSNNGEMLTLQENLGEQGNKPEQGVQPQKKKIRRKLPSQE